MMDKLYITIKQIVDEHVDPITAKLKPPEVLTVITSEIGGGTATCKSEGPVSFKSKMQLEPGMVVVGVPIGAKLYYVVGTV